mgnify:CR=1 FL=1
MKDDSSKKEKRKTILPRVWQIRKDLISMVCHERNNLHESGDFLYEVHTIESELKKSEPKKSSPEPQSDD